MLIWCLVIFSWKSKGSSLKTFKVQYLKKWSSLNFKLSMYSKPLVSNWMLLHGFHKVQSSLEIISKRLTLNISLITEKSGTFYVYVVQIIYYFPFELKYVLLPGPTCTVFGTIVFPKKIICYNLGIWLYQLIFRIKVESFAWWTHVVPTCIHVYFVFSNIVVGFLWQY